jgi:uncharacterized protein YndB with AHSA1/START domain
MMHRPTPLGCPISPQTAHQFAVTTTAEPATVWTALTNGDLTSRYLNGLAAHSTWSPGALLTLRAGSGPAAELTGQVLRADPPRRLSYLLRSGPHDPATFLTWQLRATPGGTTLRLQIDEVEGSSDDDAEDTWLPVLAGLCTLLEPAPSTASQSLGNSQDQRAGRLQPDRQPRASRNQNRLIRSESQPCNVHQSRGTDLVGHK